MAKPVASGFSDAYASVAADLRQRLGDTLAAEAGPPTSVEVEAANDDDRVRAWNEPHPESQAPGVMEQMAQQRYAEHLRTLGSPEKAVQATAEDLTHFRYRARLKIYTNGLIAWKDQVNEAKRMKRLSEKRGTEQNEEGATPDVATPERASGY